MALCAGEFVLSLLVAQFAALGRIDLAVYNVYGLSASHIALSSLTSTNGVVGRGVDYVYSFAAQMS